MTSWKLPLIVSGIAVPIVVAFWLGGPGAGVAAGALVAVAIIVVAANQRPQGPIVSMPAQNGNRHVLITVTRPVEDPATIQEIVREAKINGSPDGSEAEVMVLAPARIGFLRRWTSDIEPARHQAQENLVLTIAALARAGVAAEARVGDEDVVQAVEDQLQSFSASEVVLVSGGTGDSDAPAELESRLESEFHHIVLSDN